MLGFVTWLDDPAWEDVMEATDNNATTVRGPVDTGIDPATGLGPGQRFLDRAELIERMAKAMRLKSGIDLPHAYFVEQVKLQLAGSPAFDRSLLGPESGKAKGAVSYQSADCFRAWALRE
jgi:hypothetical protein